MNILRRSPRGFVKTIVLIVILILILFYFGVDVNHLVEVVGNFFKTILDLIIKLTKGLVETIQNALQ